MKKVIDYIKSALGVTVAFSELQNQRLSGMPFFLKLGFKYLECQLIGRTIILAEPKSTEDFLESGDFDKILIQMSSYFNFPIALVLNGITSGVRRRLIEQGINFIVPDKQLFLPSLLIEMNETFIRPKTKQEVLTPSAQLMFLYHFLNDDKPLEDMSFKEVAEQLGYSQMGITKAVDVLQQVGLCEVRGGREKNIQFKWPKYELWQQAQPLLIDPVLQRVYVRDVPPHAPHLMAGLSALPLYTDLNEIGRQYLAMEKNIFYGLRNSDALPELNEYSGDFCLEVWKYDPIKLTGNLSLGIVDPLSLYLSLKNNPDERIQIELEKLISRQPWYRD